MSKLGFAFALVVALVSTSNQASAQPSFAGTWKLNLAKSQLTGQTVSIEKAPSGLMHFDSQGFGYDFDLSGKEFPTPDGGTIVVAGGQPDNLGGHEQGQRQGDRNLPIDLERRYAQRRHESHQAGGRGGGTELLMGASLRWSRPFWQVEINRGQRRPVDDGDRARGY